VFLFICPISRCRLFGNSTFLAFSTTFRLTHLVPLIVAPGNPFSGPPVFFSFVKVLFYVPGFSLVGLIDDVGLNWLSHRACRSKLRVSFKRRSIASSRSSFGDSG